METLETDYTEMQLGRECANICIPRDRFVYTTYDDDGDNTENWLQFCSVVLLCLENDYYPLASLSLYALFWNASVRVHFPGQLTTTTTNGSTGQYVDDLTSRPEKYTQIKINCLSTFQIQSSNASSSLLYLAWSILRLLCRVDKSLSLVRDLFVLCRCPM